MTSLDMALHLHSIGINPVLLRGKVPIEKGWQTYKLPEAETGWGYRGVHGYL